MVDVLPYGSWPSPLSAAWAAEAAPRFDGAALVDGAVWWGLSLPAEGGRTTVRRRTAAGDEDLLPAPWSARSRVHEYGGGSWTARPDGRLFFVEKSDQRVYVLTPGAAPSPLTHDEGDARYGGLRWQHGMLLAVRERHTGAPVPVRDIVAVDPAGRGVRTLAAGSDFVAQPALSPAGDRLAWVSWDHPDMPWDHTRIRVGRMTDAAVTGVVDATDGATAALQPEWVGDGLLFADDPTGRWNLWRWSHEGATAVSPADADTGGALWVLGQRWYAPRADGSIVAIRTDGGDALVRIGTDGEASVLPLPADARLNIEAADGERVVVSGMRAGTTGLWLVHGDDRIETVAGDVVDVDAAWFPAARRFSVEGPRGPVHAIDYAPTNPEARGPEDELPPYVVFVHGGPTTQAAGAADAKVAFFTSRGIGVLDVDYGGSTGYGRAYRERLRGGWGVVDVADVAAAAAGLVAEGRADVARIAVEGGSAGGWTALCALANTEVFAAGISRFGVGDARLLAADTHDFEARYLDGLIGPLPQAEAEYVERSPLTHADRFRVPMLLLQGSEDAVVPPAQSEALRDALAARGVPHAYIVYEGEGHGFRRADTIIDVLQSEVAFLGRVFGFETPGIPPLDLD